MNPFSAIYVLVNDGEFVAIGDFDHYYLVPRKVYESVILFSRAARKKFAPYEITDKMYNALGLP